MLGKQVMVRIRVARPGDAEAIASVQVETWRAAYAGVLPDEVLVKMSRQRHAAVWSRTIARHGSGEIVLVAEDAGAGIVGFGSCGRARGENLPYEGEVYTLYVLHDHQGEGIGKGLLGALFRRLLKGGIESALVWVLAENPARFFYETMGGQRIAERREKLWGVVLPEAAYGWADLGRALAPAAAAGIRRPGPAQARRRPQGPSHA